MSGPFRLGKGERAVVWVLCRLLPAGFRARQRSEWTGDLIAIGGGGAGARWRYLLAAAWTLPALRGQVRRSGLDRSGPAVQISVPAALITRIFYAGLGLPVLAWFIAIPFRYVLLDIPGRLAHMGGDPQPVDPKELWPVDGPLVVLIPLWVVVSVGAWAAVIGPLLSAFMAFTMSVVMPKYLFLHGIKRVACAVFGIVLFLMVGWYSLVQRSEAVPVLYFAIDRGLSAGMYGFLTLLSGVSFRGLSRGRRLALVLVGLGGIAVFVTHHTAVGEAMLTWYRDMPVLSRAAQ